MNKELQPFLKDNRFILTMWNVNEKIKYDWENITTSFILTMWNVNSLRASAFNAVLLSFILTMWNVNEGKLKVGISKPVWFYINYVECKF